VRNDEEAAKPEEAIPVFVPGNTGGDVAALL
jgi:hypothetical protein